MEKEPVAAKSPEQTPVDRDLPVVARSRRLFLLDPGAVLEKDRLMGAVWPDTTVEDNNLSQNISILRRVLGERRGSHRYIVTVPGRGYRFVAEVRSRDGVGEMEKEPVAAKSPEQTPVDRDLPVVARSRRLFLLGLAGLALSAAAFLFWRHRPALPVPEKSIAVLPFENLSPDPENAYFANGISDEILARLANIADLKVISRSSAQKGKSAPENLGELARQLGVAYALEGTVQKSGDTARVTIQLINARNDITLWTERYDRQLTDIFQVETEVAQRVATELEATLSGSEKRALNARPTANVEAHQAYLIGRFFWNKRTVEGYQQAIEHFNRAIELDPAYAQAYAGLADAFLFLGGDNVPGQEEMLRRGRAALMKALELDEALAEAHASRGLLAMLFDWKWAEAEKELKRAIELNPNYATAHQWYGEFLADLGRFDEGVSEMKRAYELDPLSLIIATDVAKVYTIARRYDEAEAQYKKVLEMDPGFAQARGLLALTYSLNGKPEEAVGEIRKIKDVESNPTHLAWRGYVYAMSGRKDDAEQSLQQLRDLSNQTYVSPLWTAFIYTGLGEKDAAFKWLEKAFAEHVAGGAIPLKVNPVFDNLRPDPRFTDLLRRANLVP
jgi:TolB-like protein/DNA-binding winged helix-turn-helix (wHTH) protein/Tfp pilus assembly protein PilF